MKPSKKGKNKEKTRFLKKIAKIFGGFKKSPYLCIAFQNKGHLKKVSYQPNVWRDGRVVDYSGLENRRAERHRGFESLSLRETR